MGAAPAWMREERTLTSYPALSAAVRHPAALARAAPLVLAVGTAFALAQAAVHFGAAADLGFAIISLGTLAAIGLGSRVHHPSTPRPWRFMQGAIVLFIASSLLGATGEAVIGDLSASRPVLPDLVSISGYVLLAWSLQGMVRARYSQRADRADALLDAGLTALCALCLLWVFAIGRSEALEASPAFVRMLLVTRPVMSSFLVATAARLAFSAGARPGFAVRVVLGGMPVLLVGDVGMLLADVGVVDSGSRLLNVPYAVATAGCAAAALHPSMRHLTAPLSNRGPGPIRFRLALVALALVLPGVVAVAQPHLGPADRLAVALIVAALTTTAVIRVVRALSGQARAQQRLTHQATHDEVTGLPNRVHLADQLPELVLAAHERSRRVAVLFLDLDGFKVVNDSLGHSVGDCLLAAVADRLVEVIGPKNLVARLGGDEFVIVLVDVADEAEAMAIAERTRKRLNEPVPVAALQIATSTSIGVALSTSGDHDAHELIRDADTAMYRAKDRGRNSVVKFDPSMLARAARRLELDAELRRAIERRQLRLAYQPVVSVDDGRVIGFEALARWEHPTLGDVTPTEFIPVAEDTGVILELGAWALDEACRQLVLWRTSVPGGADLEISVNVSARQLRDVGFVSTVAEVLDRWGLPGNALWLELTERLLVDDEVTSDGTLARLRGLGVQLSVDDFGTGYSSLAYLKRLPVDQVKVDRSFVIGVGVPGSADDRLVGAIVGLARALGMSTLAEGVETPAQSQRLRALGVDAAQGYLFGRPVPPEAVPTLLRTNVELGSTVAGDTSDDPAAVGR